MNRDWREMSVDLGDRSYPIIMGWDILNEFGRYFKQTLKANKVMLVSNAEVFKLYGQQVTNSLLDENIAVTTLLVPDGEEAKSLDQLARAYDCCCQAKLDRKSAVIALGGGIVGDFAGFVAATFMRGMGFVQVPTTLLAQVDSSVGGKVGINLPQGKNLVGAFYQPEFVYMDLKTLKSLPERELKTGLAEIIKYGVIDGEDLFKYLEEKIGELLELEAEVLMTTVAKSCEIKSNIVSLDEKESGIRAVLNFGHTIGHAIEALTGFQQYRHGEAVAIGMRYAGLVALEYDYWSIEEQSRLESLIKKVGLPTNLPPTEPEKIVAAMELDKKNTSGQLTMILPKKIGQLEIIADVSRELVKKVVSFK
ncbi:MAG: 3-dehydroquinate synthase [Bacillota bacterium]|nr:3-dehydroquinate synthase [Bacillota bacterium]